MAIPFTRLHWEAHHVGRRFPLARGWEIQRDVGYNALLHGDRARRLTADAYERWPHDTGVSVVALPDVALDPAGRDEARVIRGRPPFLRLVHRSRHPQVFAVRGARPVPRRRRPGCG